MSRMPAAAAPRLARATAAPRLRPPRPPALRRLARRAAPGSAPPAPWGAAAAAPPRLAAQGPARRRPAPAPAAAAGPAAAAAGQAQPAAAAQPAHRAPRAGRAPAPAARAAPAWRPSRRGCLRRGGAGLGGWAAFGPWAVAPRPQPAGQRCEPLVQGVGGRRPLLGHAHPFSPAHASHPAAAARSSLPAYRTMSGCIAPGRLTQLRPRMAALAWPTLSIWTSAPVPFFTSLLGKLRGRWGQRAKQHTEWGSGTRGLKHRARPLSDGAGTDRACRAAQRAHSLTSSTRPKPPNSVTTASLLKCPGRLRT